MNHKNSYRNLLVMAILSFISMYILMYAIIAGLVFFMFIRQQTGISDKQFLRSMIPYHSGAILMCGQASINDPEIKELYESIISSQQEEITQMEAILDRLEK